MKEIPEAVKAFFCTYPDAEQVFEVSGQLFHANAKEAAEARAAYYGLTIQTYQKDSEDTDSNEGSDTNTTGPEGVVANATEGVTTEGVVANTTEGVTTEGVVANATEGVVKQEMQTSQKAKKTKK